MIEINRFNVGHDFANLNTRSYWCDLFVEEEGLREIDIKKVKRAKILNVSWKDFLSASKFFDCITKKKFLVFLSKNSFQTNRLLLKTPICINQMQR